MTFNRLLIGFLALVIIWTTVLMGALVVTFIEAVQSA